jgi:hypothetical protein
VPAIKGAEIKGAEIKVARRSKTPARPAHEAQPRAPRRRATTVATGGRLVLTDGPASARLFTYMAGNYLHRIERERRELYFGDLDLALVAEIIGTAGVEPGMRDLDFRQKHRGFDRALALDEMRAVNASSISIAAGIPRETVRRKIRKLLKLGFIVEKEPARYVLKPGVLLEPHRQAAFARGIDETVQFINALVEHGLLRWVPGRAVSGDAPR